VWDKSNGTELILAAKVDKFVGTSLNKALMRSNTNEGDRPQNQTDQNKRWNNRGKANNEYYNDIFTECPRKLVDVVVNDNLAYLAPGRRPPEAKEVEKLYKDLWGKMGSSDPAIPQGCASGGLIHEYFPPIIAEEISKRIKKIRNRTATGPNGLEKKHLLIPDLPKVLVLLFNIICYTSYYPEGWRENRTTLIPKSNKDPNKAENWRPITIGPILVRIFFSTLDRRIRRGIVQNIRQRGFTFENECKINTDFLNDLLRCLHNSRHLQSIRYGAPISDKAVSGQERNLGPTNRSD
jgi:hypothetical protein